ncbi:MAG TPA: serine/threonine-protein kinase [Kofleriaceae bacterium]|jgi:serine/threonine protein kinase
MDAGGAPLDRYVVLEHLSEGGMGAIYVGKKLGAGGFEMEVVLKQLLPEFTQQEEFIDLFLREAKLSATLDHANIVHTIDLVTAGGEYFIVMEYLPGGDLRTLLKKAKRRGKRLSPAVAIFITREVLSALAYAHVKRDLSGNPLRLIHRDVSPSNILVSYAGEVKLTDFGIAKAATHTSLFYKVKGKIGYMSPEQAKSEPLDHRSDLYSLAVCMYEVLTGERLFVHAGITTSAEEIYSQPIPQVSRKVPGLPAELDSIMARALALSPDDRYQTAGELNEAITRCAHRNGLLISAPEVARELLSACGPVEMWRDDGDADDHSAARAGTEVYDHDDDNEGEEDAPAMLPVRRSFAGVTTPSKAMHVRPSTMHLEKGAELTSIINMMDLEREGSVASPVPAPAPAPARRIAQPHKVAVSTGDTVHAPAGPPPPPPTPPMAVALPAPPTPVSLPTPSLPAHHAHHANLAVAPPPAMPTPHPLALADLRSQQRHAQQVVRPTAMAPRAPSPIRPWMVIVAILVAAGVAAVIIALSGPDVAVLHVKP